MCVRVCVCKILACIALLLRWWGTGLVDVGALFWWRALSALLSVSVVEFLCNSYVA